MMGSEGASGFFERISGPYLIKFNDYLSAFKDNTTRLLKMWDTLSPAERRRRLREIKQLFHNMRMTARASAMNQRVRLDTYLEAAKQRVRMKYVRRIDALKRKYEGDGDTLRAKVAEEQRAYIFEKMEEQITEMERVMQPIMLLTPQNAGYDLLDATIGEVIDQTLSSDRKNGPGHVGLKRVRLQTGARRG